MLKLLGSVIERYVSSFFDIIPEVTKNWFILYKYAFYAGAVFIYALTFIVLLTVILIIMVIAVPASSLYKSFFMNHQNLG
jgi:hypothetical protein